MERNSRLIKLPNFLHRDPRLLALFDQALVSGCGFLSLVVVGRYLPAAEFGPFSLAVLATLFLANMHRAVFTQPLNVLGAGESAAMRSARIKQILRAHGLAIPLAIVFLAAIAWFYFPEVQLLLSCIVYSACFLLQETARRFWYTGQRFERALLSDAISYGGQLILLLVAGTFWQLDGALAFLLMGATSLIAFMIDILSGDLLAGERQSGQSPPSSLLAQHWPMSKWLVLTVLAVWGATQLYPFLLAPLGAAAVAAFVASRNLLNALNVVTQTVGDFLPVRAAALLRQQGKTALAQHLRQTMIRCTLGGILFVLIIMLIARPLLDLVYKGMYNQAADLLIILAVGRLFGLLGVALGAYSQAMQDTRASFIANLAATGFNFTVGLWLIHHSGLQGAALSATIGGAVAMVVQGVLVCLTLRKLPEPALKAAPKEAFAGGSQ